MEWIDATTETPTGYLVLVYLKISWHVKRYGVRKAIGFYNPHTKEFICRDGGSFKPKYVQWLNEDGKPFTTN